MTNLVFLQNYDDPQTSQMLQYRTRIDQKVHESQNDSLKGAVISGKAFEKAVNR